MATASPKETASSVVKPAVTQSPSATLADDVLVSAHNYCRDVAAYNESDTKYGCSVCGILRPEVRVPHSCDHPICEPCAAERARLGKPCWCGEPFWLWEACDFSSAGVSSSSSSSSDRSAYTHPSPAASRALAHLVFSCPNACDRPAGIAFRDLVRHCTDDAACANAWVDCGDCKRRVRSLGRAAHARECESRLVRCTACDTADIRYCDLETHYARSCPKTIVHCPNGHCCAQLARDEMPKHLADTCPHQNVPCVMARFGCDFFGARRLHDAHVLDGAAQHLRLTVAAHADIETSVGVLATRLAALADAFSKRDESEVADRSDNSGGGGDDDAEKTARREPHGTESKSPVCQEIAAVVTAAAVVPIVVATPSPASSGPSGPRCADTDLPRSEMKRRLESAMSQEPTDRPLVLAADRYNAWYVASVVADIDLKSTPSDASGGTRSVGVRFDGFNDDEDNEKAELMGGRIRPLFDSRRSHSAFLADLRAGDTIECRVPDPIVWRWVPCAILWRYATEMGVRKRDNVGLDGVHVLTDLRARCLPLGVASRLPPYSPDAFPPHTA